MLGDRDPRATQQQVPLPKTQMGQRFLKPQAEKPKQTRGRDIGRPGDDELWEGSVQASVSYAPDAGQEGCYGLPWSGAHGGASANEQGNTSGELKLRGESRLGAIRTETAPGWLWVGVVLSAVAKPGYVVT